MPFRIGRKYASHTYPESRGLAAPPLSAVGFNATAIDITGSTEETIATTSTSLTFDGKTDVTVLVSFEFEVLGVEG